MLNLIKQKARCPTYFLLINIFLFNLNENHKQTCFGCIIIGTEQLEHNLCRTKVCPNYSKCKINENLLVPECYCSEGSCNPNDYVEMLVSSLKNVNISQTQVVCGNDGKDYENFCQLRQASCKQNKEIKIAYIGPCG